MVYIAIIFAGILMAMFTRRLNLPVLHDGRQTGVDFVVDSFVTQCHQRIYPRGPAGG
jgi:hypothetical protein